MEGSGARSGGGSILVINESGCRSGRPKNIRITDPADPGPDPLQLSAFPYCLRNLPVIQLTWHTPCPYFLINEEKLSDYLQKKMLSSLKYSA